MEDSNSNRAESWLVRAGGDSSKVVVGFSEELKSAGAFGAASAQPTSSPTQARPARSKTHPCCLQIVLQRRFSSFVFDANRFS